MNALALQQQFFASPWMNSESLKNRIILIQITDARRGDYTV